MRPRFRPTVERLEAQTLLSGLGPLPAALPPPPLTLTLATDRSVYQVGQPVHMTLTETNTTAHDVTFADGPSIDGFYVTSSTGATVWRSNAGIQPLFLRLVVLHPGQSYTLQATWDGHPNDPWGNEQTGVTPTGTFQVHTQVNPSATPATFTIQPSTPPASGLTVSVTTDHASYRVGQPVTITLTETNTGKSDATVLTGGQILHASVSGPLGPVWVYRDPRAIATGHGVLHPGQSRTFTLTWDGKANVPGGLVVPGSYTVFAGVDGLLGAAVIHVRT
jgi:hypothetical protein